MAGLIKLQYFPVNSYVFLYFENFPYFGIFSQILEKNYLTLYFQQMQILVKTEQHTEKFWHMLCEYFSVSFKGQVHNKNGHFLIICIAIAVKLNGIE